MKCLSVLGSKLLDQVLQGGELSPVDEVELLQVEKKSYFYKCQHTQSLSDTEHFRKHAKVFGVTLRGEGRPAQLASTSDLSVIGNQKYSVRIQLVFTMPWFFLWPSLQCQHLLQNIDFLF